MQRSGQVAQKLKTPWRDGTTHRVTSPLDFMQRPLAPAPRPRVLLIRFHGVLPPNAKLRAQVVPAGQADDGGARQVSQAVEPHDPHRWAARGHQSRSTAWLRS